MKKYSLALPVVIIFSLCGQTLVDLATQAKNVDFSRAVSTIPTKSGAVLPASCKVGEQFFKTDNPPGKNLYSCAPANTWSNVSVAALAPLAGGVNGTVVVQAPLTFTGSGPNTVTSTGSLTAFDCASWDTNGNLVDAGAPCSALLAPTATTVGNLPQYANTTGTALSAGLAVVTTLGNPGSDSKIPTEKAISTALAGMTANLPLQTGSSAYLVSNGTTASWGNIVTGPSGALDCVSTAGVCDVVTSVVPLKASANVWTGANDFSASPFLKVATSAGIPNGIGCQTASDVGKVYVRSDTKASNSSMYVCSQTASGVFSWEAPGTAALGFSALTSGTNISASLLVGSGASLGTAGSGVIAATSVPASGVSGLAASATTDTTNASNITSGTLPPARLPNPTATTLGGVESLSPTAHQWISSISTTGVATSTQPAFTDISGSVAPAQMPNPSATTLGGVQSAAAVSHKWINSISTVGVPGLSQPAFTDLSGSVAPAQLPTPTAATLGGVQSVAPTAHQWLNSISTLGIPSLSQPSASDIAGLATSATTDTTNASNITSGTLPAARLPNPTTTTLGGVEALGATAHQWINSISTTGVPTSTQPAFSDISGSLAPSQLPNPTATTLGGVESVATTAHQWISSISTTGVPVLAQPAFSDISGGVAASQLPAPTATSIGGVQSAGPAAHQWINSISTLGVPSLSQPAATDISGLAASATTDTTNASNIASGTLAASRLPNPTATSLGGVQSALPTTHQWINSISVLGVPSLSQPAAADISGLAASATTDTTNASNIASGTLAAARLPNPTATSLGGVQSALPTAHQWINSISVLGVPSLSQPAATDITGLAASATTDTTNASNIASGTLASARLPNPTATSLGGVQSALPTAHQWINSISILGVPSLSQPAAADISGLAASATTDTTNASNLTSGTLAAGRLPNPSATTLGGVQSALPTAHQWINSISVLGVPSLSQPAAADITGLAASATTDTTNASNIASGTLAAARLPNPTATTLGGVQSALPTAHQWINSISILGVPSLSQPAAADISGLAASATTDTTNASNIASGTLAAARLPNPSATTLGGVQSALPTAHQWINSISVLGVPSLSQPAAADISGLAASATTDTTNASNIASGTLAAARLPNPTATTLGGVQSALATAHQWLNSISTSGVPSFSQPTSADISGLAASATTDTTNASNLTSGTLAASRLPNPTATSLGGVQSALPTAHQWVNSISVLGVPSLSQPAAADISGLAASATTDTTNASNLTSGTLAASRLPNPSATSLGGVQSALPTAHQWINSISVLGVPSLSQPAAADVSGLAASATTDTTNASNIASGTLAAARLPNPTATSLGGVQSALPTAHQWINSISVLGVPSLSQPAAADITGLAASATTDTTNASNIASGILPAARLPNPTASTLGGIQSLAVTTHQWINSISSAGVPASTQPAFTDILGSVAPTQLPNPSATTLGGVQSAAAATHKWISSISTSGVPALTQPAFADISGSVAPSQLPNPTATTLGGVESIAATPHQWVNAISTAGIPTLSQPAAADISGLASSATVDATNAANITAGTLPVGRLPLVPVANGGTGTATPSLVAGANISVSGTWPNQTIANTATIPTVANTTNILCGTGAGNAIDCGFAPTAVVQTNTTNTITTNGAASKPSILFNGSWFNGGTGSTTKPLVLIEPSGTPSSAWSNNGTALGINAASNSGNLLDLQANGISQVQIQANNNILLPAQAVATPSANYGSDSITLGGSAWISGVSYKANQVISYGIPQSSSQSILQFAADTSMPQSVVPQETVRVLGPNPGVETVNSNGNLGARMMSTYSTGLFGLVNTATSFQGIVPPTGYSMLFGFTSSGEVGTIVPMTYVTLPVFRNVLDDGSGNSSISGYAAAAELQGNGNAPTVSVTGAGCALGTPSGTNIAGLIPVTGSGSACSVTITWSASFAYPNHSLCGPLQDRTSGTMATQASDTATAAAFRPLPLTTGDTLQYGTCTGY